MSIKLGIPVTSRSCRPLPTTLSPPPTPSHPREGCCGGTSRWRKCCPSLFWTQKSEPVTSFWDPWIWWLLDCGVVPINVSWKPFSAHQHFTVKNGKISECMSYINGTFSSVVCKHVCPGLKCISDCKEKLEKGWCSTSSVLSSIQSSLNWWEPPRMQRSPKGSARLLLVIRSCFHEHASLLASSPQLSSLNTSWHHFSY